MPRLILLLSLLAITFTLLLRWWFGLRALQSTGKRQCRCDLEKWMPEPDDKASVHRAEQSASDFGKQLRRKALAAWKEQEPKAASAREGHRRFGIAVPPLSLMVAILAVLVGKIPVLIAIVIFVSATAVAAILTLSSLPAELAAITRMANQSRKAGHFPSRDDEEAVTTCALAHAWDASAPAFLRWM